MAARRANLRLVQVLHRHGDRSPLHNVFTGSDRHSAAAQEETALWQPKLSQHIDGSPIFGELTTTGVEQMQARGSALRQHVLAQGWTLDAPTLHVQSTHYMRTQRSVHALISTLAPNVEAPAIDILPPHLDFINAYNDHGPAVARLKAQLADAHTPLAAREAAMAPVKEALMRHLPLFEAHPERFTWMNAADYFVCRRAHGLPLVPHTEDLADTTIDHLSFRFSNFYTHPPILHYVASRLVDQLVARMHDVIHAVDTSPPKEQVCIYSGHDVSVLAFLYARMGAAVDASYWPDYSTAITVELYQGDDKQWQVQTTLDGQSLGVPVSVDEFATTLQSSTVEVPRRQ
ncbi:Aste57867_10924 [Aphanomyces stellatus]|uniref:Aste57867_10924 protein n=1 Tax=Aphanomyces stellatus TaxID=120398 RepID=A0A485KRR2_9STRA|nr:hypothetical protein As57867_010884 [Aphanomyces stellatus]VFT87792.1 Aste57867_10924 [Aphanomyces stellatus]